MIYWTLWRQDDNGSSFEIAKFESEDAAKKEMNVLEERAHKQHYWITRDSSPATTSINLIVLKSRDLENARRFYEEIGCQFHLEKHGNGPEHYSWEAESVVFEIYPGIPAGDSLRLGFCVPNIEETVRRLPECGGEIVIAPRESKWGMRSVVKDPDGHPVEITEFSP